jgi:hypothetical protein
MPESTYGHTSRVIQNLSLKFKLRHFAPTQNVKFELMGTSRNRNVGKRNDDFRKSCLRNPKSLFRKNPGAAHYPGSRRAVYYSLYPKLICSLFSGKRPKTSAIRKKTNPEVEELPLAQFVFGMIKIRFQKFDCISEGESGVSHAEKYLTLRYNKNRITRRSSQKEYKSFLPENSSSFSSFNPWERVRKSSLFDMLEFLQRGSNKNAMEIIYDD